MTATVIKIETRTAAELADELGDILQDCQWQRLEEVPGLLQAIAAQLPALHQLRELEQAASDAMAATSRGLISTN